MKACIEASMGVDRLFLAVVCSAFEEDEVNGEKRSVLKFHPAMAPVKVAILPLVKKDAGINDIAAALYGDLKKRYNCQLDAAGNIGRRYRRQDEIGTPLCVTVDVDSLAPPTPRGAPRVPEGAYFSGSLDDTTARS